MKKFKKRVSSLIEATLCHDTCVMGCGAEEFIRSKDARLPSLDIWKMKLKIHRHWNFKKKLCLLQDYQTKAQEMNPSAHLSMVFELNSQRKSVDIGLKNFPTHSHTER